MERASAAVLSTETEVAPSKLSFEYRRLDPEDILLRGMLGPLYPRFSSFSLLIKDVYENIEFFAGARESDSTQSSPK